MKAYGVKRKDFGCCPGHDRFPKFTYNSRRSKKARTKHKLISNKLARNEEKQIILKEKYENNILPPLLGY